MLLRQVFVALVLTSCASGQTRFSVTFDSKEVHDGRLLLMLAPNNKTEPREQVGADKPDTAIIYGIDVDGWKAGQAAVFDAKTFGFPVRSLSQVPSGRYWVQALLHKYETFRRSDGHTVKLPMDRGEGQKWNLAPGNLLSAPMELVFDASKPGTVDIKLTKAIPPITPPKDTRYVKHVRIQSERLTKFWGRPMHLGASVLLPEGWDTHPDSRYPLVVYHGHFSPTIGGFREQPPDPNLKPDYSERFKVHGYNRMQQELAHEFYKDWTGRGFPRVLLVEVQHANPYYDDSYAVNSANLGPYGDAIMYELIPYIEKQFRGLGTGWSRTTYGGSTGGWEALAVQIFYPDAFNGSYGACPDPIDFRAYTTINLYEHNNAYYVDSAVKRTPRPAKRNWLGEVSATVEEMNHLELVLGTKSRSGDQFDIWEAVYSPVGSDGYPKRIFDKMTGKIDREVANHWRENYDLAHILRRDWAKLGPKLEGKINIYCGDMDNYYLNNAVYLMEDFLKSTRSPYYGGEVEYGDRAEHCWNGDHTRPNHISRLRYHQMYIPRIAERIVKTAPTGADITSWRY
jgi:hypothetical protein